MPRVSPLVCFGPWEGHGSREEVEVLLRPAIAKLTVKRAPARAPNGAPLREIRSRLISTGATEYKAVRMSATRQRGPAPTRPDQPTYLPGRLSTAGRGAGGIHPSMWDSELDGLINNKRSLLRGV